MTVAEVVLSHGGVVAIEWPQQCAYWEREEVKTFLAKHNLVRAIFHGCAYGLVSKAASTLGMPIKKPWTVATNSAALRAVLNRHCSKDHEHIQCGGTDLRRTEEYTDELVDVIHDGFANHLRGAQRGAACHHAPALCASARTCGPCHSSPRSALVPLRPPACALPAADTLRALAAAHRGGCPPLQFAPKLPFEVNLIIWKTCGRLDALRTLMGPKRPPPDEGSAAPGGAAPAGEGGRSYTVRPNPYRDIRLSQGAAAGGATAPGAAAGGAASWLGEGKGGAPQRPPAPPDSFSPTLHPSQPSTGCCSWRRDSRTWCCCRRRAGKGREEGEGREGGKAWCCFWRREGGSPSRGVSCRRKARCCSWRRGARDIIRRSRARAGYLAAEGT